MPSHQHRRGGNAPSGGSSSELPAWSADQDRSSNQDIIELLTRAQVDEQVASQALEGTGFLDQFEQQEAKSSPRRGPTAGARPRGGTLQGVYDDNAPRQRDMKLSLSREQANSVMNFRAHYKAHKGRYEKVAAKTGVPAKLIAALHWRESTGDFGTYLHQGDPLGKKAVNVPKNIPLFHVWEDAAEHALNMKKGNADAVGMSADMTDEVAMATYAEAYNGLGYSYKDRPSPYVYAGTDQYQAGKYVRDGKYDKNHVDQQPGVMALMESLDLSRSPQADPKAGWRPVLAGALVLRRGDDGDGVLYMQQRLVAHGATLTPDGDFGGGTVKAVKRFQRAHDLEPDGAVGKGTAEALDKAPSRRSS